MTACRPPADGLRACAAGPSGYNPADVREPRLGSRRPCPSPCPVDASRRSPPCAPSCRPSDALFTFMRDAELRFETLRMRIEEHTWTARGEHVLDPRRHAPPPGEVKVLATEPVSARPTATSPWVSDGTTVRTYSRRVSSARERPVRPMVGGSRNPDLPGMSRVYGPLTALPMETLPDTFVHPGGFCQNVLATGAAGCRDVDRRRTRGDRPRVRSSRGRSRSLPTGPTHHPGRVRPRRRGDRPAGGDHRRRATRDARRDQLVARRAAPALDLRVHLPDRDDADLLATRAAGSGRDRGRRDRALPTSRTRTVEPAIVAATAASTAANTSEPIPRRAPTAPGRS